MFCCSSVSDVGTVVVAFEAVSCCISMGDVRVRLFCCFVGVVWYQMVSHSELLDGTVWQNFPFVSIVVL